MISGPDARVHPGTVMVVPLNAPLANIAVVASRYRDNTTLETELVNFEALEKLTHGYIKVSLDIAWTPMPCQESH